MQIKLPKLPALPPNFPVKRARIAAAILGALLTLWIAWRLVFGGTFLYAGTVEATEVDISARVPSVIAAVDVKEGDAVARGAVLLRLACEDLRLAADLAEGNFRRAATLFKGGSLPQAEYDRIKFLRDDAALKRGWCTVRSPLDGTVLSLYFEPGEMVAPGTRLATVADTREVWAFVYVAQPVIVKLKPGMEVRGSLAETGRKKYKGRIAHIRDKAEFTPKNVQTRDERTRLVYGVKVVFPNPDGLLKPGMTIEVRLPAR